MEGDASSVTKKSCNRSGGGRRGLSWGFLDAMAAHTGLNPPESARNRERIFRADVLSEISLKRRI